MQTQVNNIFEFSFDAEADQVLGKLSVSVNDI